MRSHFDVVVIGAGMAGLNAMARAAADGRSVAIIEREIVGGTCPIRGCIPTKAFVRSAEVAHEISRASEFGIRVGEVDVDFGAVMDRVRGIIDRGASATRAWVTSLPGVELIEGEATFVGPRTVEVDGRVLTAPSIVIATGAVPARPPIPGLDRTPYLVSDDVLRLTELPRRLLVIGAGPIALELGQALVRLGAEVTMFDIIPRLLPGGEPELAEVLGRRLAAEGVRLVLDATVVRTAPMADGGAEVVVRTGDDERVYSGDALLVAAGRVPETAALDLAAAGIASDRGAVIANTGLQTASPGVYAAGDVLGPAWGAHTHIARRQGVEVADRLLGAHDGPVDPNIGLFAIFTDPEVAAVGMTEAAARAAGHQIAVGTANFSGGKARAWGEEGGLVKIIVAREGRRLLGAHLVGYHAADLIHPLVVAMTLDVDVVDAIGRTPHIHPTLGEVVKSAVEVAA